MKIVLLDGAFMPTRAHSTDRGDNGFGITGR